MSARRALALAVIATAGAAMLHVSGSNLPVPPVDDPSQLDDWWNARGTALAALSAARVVGLALCCYLAVISLLALSAVLTRWQWLATLTGWASTSAVRRLLVGGSLAVALSAPPAAAASPASFSITDVGPAAHTQPVFTATDVGPIDTTPAVFTATDVGPIDTTPATFTATDVGPADTTPATFTATDVGPADTTPATFTATDVGPIDTTPATQSRDDTRVVSPGDNLWGIAADTVASRTGSTEPHTVLRYWQDLVEANSDALGGNPDLIHPGQVIRLPG